MGKEYLKDIQISDDILLNIFGAKDRSQLDGMGIIYKRNGAEWDRIGRVGFYVNLNEYILYWLDLYVDEEYRHQGIGTTVYRWLEKYFFTEYDVRTICLVLDQEESLLFWEKVGFKGIEKELSESSLDYRDLTQE